MRSITELHQGLLREVARRGFGEVNRRMAPLEDILAAVMEAYFPTERNASTARR